MSGSNFTEGEHTHTPYPSAPVPGAKSPVLLGLTCFPLNFVSIPWGSPLREGDGGGSDTSKLTPHGGLLDNTHTKGRFCPPTTQSFQKI